MNKVAVTELSRSLPDFINRAAYRGEEFLITRGGKPVAALSPVPTGVRVKDLARVFENLPHQANEDLDASSADLDDARKVGNVPIRDPWQSS